jgi:hypothetical protein
MLCMTLGSQFYFLNVVYPFCGIGINVESSTLWECDKRNKMSQ